MSGPEAGQTRRALHPVVKLSESSTTVCRGAHGDRGEEERVVAASSMLEPSSGAGDAGGSPPIVHVSWEDLDQLVSRLVGQLDGAFDLMLAVTRGGLVPAGMLAYRLGIREILVTGVVFYDHQGPRPDGPQFLSFPEAELLRDRRVLVVDEVWESGSTMAAVCERVLSAGGQPVSAVLHYKPGRSRLTHGPDHHAATTDHWVVYPYKAGQ